MTNLEIKKEKNEIPIFFSTDNNYAPFLDVALRSLIFNASKEFMYHIVILHTGVDIEIQNKIKTLENNNFKIDFANVSNSIKDIEHKLPIEQHFGLATWYRLFIQNLFPQYDKILYLDCDIVVLGDISKLYFTDIEENYVAGVIEHWILNSPIFSRYTKEAVGIESNKYINAGIMIINLQKFRENKIEEKFIELINKYNFNVIDPDQAYINFLCQGKIKYLPFEWNRTPIEIVDCENPKIVHYALSFKPWQKPDMFLSQYFWNYAKSSPFYNTIMKEKNSFDELAFLKKERAGIDIQIKAIEYIESDNTFKKKLIAL